MGEGDNSEDYEPEPRRVTRPPNAFMLFGKERRPLIAKDNPNLSNKEVSKLLGKEWHSLSDQEKDKYFQQSKLASQRHKQQHPGDFTSHYC